MNNHPVEEQQSESELMKKAEQGDPEAQTKIGDKYCDENPVYAKSWYTKAAMNEYGSAQYKLGKLYETGRGVKKDISKALEWYVPAAAHGKVDAMIALGNIYRYGEAGKRDYKEASKWFQQAVKKTNAGYSHNLAKIGLEDATLHLDRQKAGVCVNCGSEFKGITKKCPKCGISKKDMYDQLANL